MHEAGPVQCAGLQLLGRRNRRPPPSVHAQIATNNGSSPSHLWQILSAQHDVAHKVQRPCSKRWQRSMLPRCKRALPLPAVCQAGAPHAGGRGFCHDDGSVRLVEGLNGLRALAACGAGWQLVG